MESLIGWLIAGAVIGLALKWIITSAIKDADKEKVDEK